MINHAFTKLARGQHADGSRHASQCLLQRPYIERVVGISFDYSPMGQANDMLMVTATGTAVKIRPIS